MFERQYMKSVTKLILTDQQVQNKRAFDVLLGHMNSINLSFW